MPAKNGTFLDIATSITLSTSPADLTLALYSDGGGAPGNLLYYHAGNGSATLSTGTLMNGFTGQLFAGGSYWLAVSTNGASAQVTSAAGGGACVFLPWNGTTPPNQAWTGVQACNAGSFEIVLQVTFP